MADNSIRNAKDDNRSPTSSFPIFNANNFRDIIQRQIQMSIDREVNAVKNLSIGSFDGRFLNQYPGAEETLGDGNGNYYFLAGASRVGDLSVAAP